jgi:hypothetical protein
MSDVTFRPALTAPSGIPVIAMLRAGGRRLRQIGGQVAEAVHTYSVIEVACLLAAMAFCGEFAAAAFGVSI